MKFMPAADDLENGLTNRIVSEDGRVEIGVYRVFFGWRVRAGFVGEPICNLDWCAGGEEADLVRLYQAARRILEQRESGPDCFAGLPAASVIKPFYNDPEFMSRLARLLETPGRG